MNAPRQAVVLLSGGLDSATTLAIARAQGFECAAMSFAYGQRHATGLSAARRVAAALGVREHRVVEINLRAFGGSALTSDLEVPKGGETAEGEIPATYVPARNTIFLAYALAWAEVLDARDIFLGVNAVDYSGYPDCRPEFIAAFQKVANLATKVAIEGTGPTLHAPLIDMSKADIIRRGTELGLDYAMTQSCYDPIDDRACGSCDSCRLRREGFEAAGISDPTLYAEATQ
jgi:7-cyano-7-deazaguanine synthase